MARLTYSRIEDWLTSRGVTTPMRPGPRGYDSPDKLVVVTLQPGAGTLMEDLFDVPAFQLRSRGSVENYADAETLAFELDDLVLSADLPATLEGCYVDAMGRTGGAPVALGPPDSGGRFEFVCSYWARCQTNL